MSTSHLVVLYPRTNQYIDPVIFQRDLQTKWPQAEISLILDTRRYYLLEWYIYWEDGGRLHGLLDKELQSIALSGSGAGLEEGAKFAVWFQELHPEMKNLIFVDEQAAFDVDVYGRTAEEIIQLAQRYYSFLHPERNDS